MTAAPQRGDELADMTLIAGQAENTVLSAFHAQSDDESTDDALAVGTTAGRYVLLDRVGAGGMGVVYAAYDPRLDRKVALKFVRPNVTAQSEDDTQMAGARLEREARAMARVAHPNVVTVFDAGVFEGRVFIAMEFLVGTTLKGWLKDAQRSQAEILDVFIAAGRGLAAAHEQDLVHRDFKPDNVLVTEAGRVAVMDFGLVAQGGSLPSDMSPGPERSQDRSFEMLGSSELTTAGTVMGTVPYMAPEQLRGEPVDARGDQFSFCVALYEALYGVRPFVARDVPKRLAAIERAMLAEPVHRVGSRRLMDAVRRGLAFDVERRHPSMASLLVELEQIRSPKRRRLAVALAAGLITAGAIGFAGQAAIGPDCARAGDAWHEVWNPGRFEAVSSAFAATEVAYSGESADRVDDALQTLGQRWQGMMQQSCHDTHVRKVQSEALMDLRTACLRRHLSAVEHLVDELRRADATAVRHAAAAANNLPRIDECADADALHNRTPPPEDEAARAELEQLRNELERGQALYLTGKYSDAHEVISPLVPRAESLAYLPILADLLLQRSRIEDGLSRFDEAHTSALRAMLTAEAAGYDKVAVGASSYLVFVSFERGQYDEGVVWRDHTTALIERTDASAYVRGTAKLNEMTLAFGQRDLDRAAALLGEAIAMLTEDSDEPSINLATTYSNLGVVRNYQNRWQEAIDSLETAWTQRVNLLGPSHPETGVTLMNLAANYAGMGEYAVAYDYALQAHELWNAVDPQAFFAAVSSMSIARVEAARGRLGRATDLLREGIASIEASAGPRSYVLAPAWVSYGEVLVAQGRVDEGERALRHANELIDTSEGGDQSEALGGRMALVSVLQARGQFAAAHTEARQVYDDAKSLWGEDDVRLASFAVVVGESLARLHRHVEAIDWLSAGIEHQNRGGDIASTTWPLVSLARSLHALGRDGDAAQALARAEALIDPQWLSPELEGAIAFAHAELAWPHDRPVALQWTQRATAAFARSEGRGSWIVDEFEHWYSGMARVE